MKKIRYFLEIKAVLGMAWVMRNMPRHLMLVFCKVVGVLAWMVDYKGRAVAMENIMVAYDGKKGWWEALRIVRGSYQNFARTFADMFWCKTITKDTWREHFVIHVDDLAAAEATRAKGVVWVTPHYANFELSSQVWGFMGREYTIVAQDFKNPGITEIFSEARSVSGHRVIPQASAMLRLIKALKKGGNVGFLTDLNVPPSKAAEVIECFGRKTCVTKLHVVLARRLGLPILPAVCRPMEDGRSEMVVFSPIVVSEEESDAQAVQRVWDVFEAEIREHPQWWLWMYKHWRYLPKQPGGVEYPSYAGHNPWFDKMLKPHSPAN